MAHPDYAAFKAGHLAKFAAWHTQNDLAAIQLGRLIRKWSESLLDAFKPGSLIEEYDFYQILTDYWAETLQDDVYLIAQDGWKAVKNLAEITKESDEAANLTVVFEETEAKSSPPSWLPAATFQTASPSWKKNKASWNA